MVSVGECVCVSVSIQVACMCVNVQDRNFKSPSDSGATGLP